MKTAALISGITLLGLSAFGLAQDAPRNSDAAATDKSPVSPAAPKDVKKVPQVPTKVAPSARPLPSDLITTSLEGKDLEFLMTALENGRVLEWLGETAKEKGQSEQLKQLGESLASTQATENKVLRELAKSKGLNVEAGGPPVQQSQIESELAKSSGEKLDKDLTDHLMTAARKSVSVYGTGAEVKDEELRKFAEQMLPKAKQKLQMVSKASGTVPDSTKTPAAER